MIIKLSSKEKKKRKDKVIIKEAIKIQVGDGASDHYCWERAEDMTTSRSAYKLDANHPGSDLAGETAAALAAAAIAFKPYNSSYSNLLLLHAKQVSSKP